VAVAVADGIDSGSGGGGSGGGTWLKSQWKYMVAIAVVVYG
jgi:hypothetical protein